jgi:hypothetical protein
MEAMCYGSQVGAAQGDTHHPEMIRCEAFTCYLQPAIWAARRKRIHAHYDDSGTLTLRGNRSNDVSL